MKTRIPPPVILLGFGIAMWWLAGHASAYVVSIPILVSAVIAAMGVAVAAAGVLEFSRARTTVNPHRINDASALVMGGVYRWTRNPMYVGLLLVLVAWMLWLGAMSNLVILLLFVVAITELQIKPEEQALAKRFGDEYDAYCRRVRRWF